MSFLSCLFSKLHIYRNLISVIDDRLKTNEVMTLSDFLESHYTRLALNTKEKGTSEEEYIHGRQLIVSLTSHGSRIYDCFLAIESIMQGTVKPNRIILWLPEEERVMCRFLQYQMDRGLKIEYVKDLGPHTKLIPALQRYPEDVIITIDDDMFYRPDMIEGLLRAYQADTKSIHANRVAVMTKDKGQLASYLKWKQYTHPTETTENNVIIGVEGCLYPPHVFSDEVFNTEAIHQLCPTADDIWFTAMALLNGTAIHHVESHYPNACAGSVMNLRMQSSGLVNLNEDPNECRNDIQIRAVFEHYNLSPSIG